MIFIIYSLLTLLTSPTHPVDQTIKIQKLLDGQAGRTIVLPKGTIWISTLNVPQRTHLIINAGTTVKGLPSIQSLPLLNLASDVQVTGPGKLDGNRRYRTKGVGIRAFDSQRIEIVNVTIAETAEQGIILAGCSNVSINKSRIAGCGTKGIDQFQAINIVTSQDVVVTGCYINGAQHGIQWWGDDSRRWCKRITIKQNSIRNVTGGGIWGNKGEDVLIDNNSITTCGDVGIDFESSRNSRAVNNTVRNCKNYGLAVFFASKAILFTKNKVYQSINFGHGIGLTGEGQSSNITFSNNTVSVKGPNRCGLITDGANVATNVIIERSTFVTTGKEGIPIRILDNSNFQILNNSGISGRSPVGISLEGSSNSTVKNNKVIHSGTDATSFGTKGGIFVYYRSSAFPAKNNIIQNNFVSGYKTGMNDDCWGDVNSNNIFEDNITPNFAHRVANGTWGGRSSNNSTVNHKLSPVKAVK